MSNDLSSIAIAPAMLVWRYAMGMQVEHWEWVMAQLLLLRYNQIKMNSLVHRFSCIIFRESSKSFCCGEWEKWHCRDFLMFTRFFTPLVQRELFAEQKYAIMSVYPVRSR